MTRGRAICEIAHTAALGFWLGALVMAGTAAAVIFPTMRELDPRLPHYVGYAGDHWLIAGGRVAAKVFWITDAVQFACMLLAGLTFGIAVMWCGLQVRRISTFARVLVLLALVGVLSYRLGFVEPGLSAALRDHWAAALAGDTAAASRFKAVFDAGHPLQTRLLSITAGLVLAAILATIASFWRAERADGRER
jgi:hypothetical protein